MNLELRTNYWSDRESRQAFQRFILEIHRLDFTAWEKAGFWDDAYRPYSYFREGEVVASVCIYSLPALIEGRGTRLIQISGVGTLPEFRRRGLSRDLTERGLADAEAGHEGVFLFSDLEAIPYYRRCGFLPVAEYLPAMEIKPVPRKDGASLLDAGNLGRIRHYAETTMPISNSFTVGNWKLFMFHALYTLPGKMWELPDLGCLVCCERQGERLQLYAVLGETMPSFEALYPYIVEPTDRAVDFHFLPDRLGVEPAAFRPLIGNNLYVQAGFPVEDPVFPYTSRA